MSAEEKPRAVVEGRQSRATISEVCRCHQVDHGQFYRWEREARELRKRYFVSKVGVSLFLQRLDTGSVTVAHFMSVVGGALSGLMAVAIGVDVISRNVFAFPIHAVVSLVTVTVPLMFSLGLGDAESGSGTGGHIRVSIFTDRFGQRRRQVVAVGVSLLCFLLIALLTWLMALSALESWSIRECQPGITRIAIYPTKITLVCAMALLCLRYLLGFWLNLSKIRRRS